MEQVQVQGVGFFRRGKFNLPSLQFGLINSAALTERPYIHVGLLNYADDNLNVGINVGLGKRG